MTDSTLKAPSLRLDRAYRILSGDDSDERACEAIPESICTDLPRNYLLNVLNGSATKLAEQLASAGLVLPWLLSAAGAPAAFSTLMPPVKQAAGLLPQLAVAGRIRRLPLRKPVWVSAGLAQSVLLAGIPVAVWLLPPLAAGIAAVLLFAAFSAASGAGSIAFQDVMGKTIPKGRRGRLLSSRATIGGALTLAAAAALMFASPHSPSLAFASVLVLGAAALWVAGSAAFAAIEEQPGATSGGRSMLREVRAGMDLLRAVPGYRAFLAARVALLSVEVGMPFFTLHAAALTGGAATDLTTLVLAVGAAQVVASPFWGLWSDRASEKVMAAAGGLAAFAGLLAVGLDLAGGALPAWLYAPVFVVLGMAEAGARLGRKTYLADGMPSDERPLYVAFSNSVAGLLALGAGLLGSMVDLTGPLAGIIAIAALAALGALLSLNLPAADRMAARSAANTD